MAIGACTICNKSQNEKKGRNKIILVFFLLCILFYFVRHFKVGNKLQTPPFWNFSDLTFLMSHLLSIEECVKDTERVFPGIHLPHKFICTTNLKAFLLKEIDKRCANIKSCDDESEIARVLGMNVALVEWALQKHKLMLNKLEMQTTVTLFDQIVYYVKNLDTPSLNMGFDDLMASD